MTIPPAIQPRLVLTSLKETVGEHVASVGRQHRAEKTAFLCDLLMTSYLRRERHRTPDHIRHLEVSTFEASWLAKHLGGNNRDSKTGLPSYQRYLEPFWTFESLNMGYSKGAQETKRYVLRPTAIAMIDEALKAAGSVEVVDAVTGLALSSTDFPKNGVYRTSYSTILVPAIVPFALPTLDLRIEEAEKGLVGLSFIDAFHRTLPLRHLRVARKWVEVLGGIPNLYSDFKGDDPTEGTGRLYGGGGLHLQLMKGTVRRELLQSRGLWDYDFSNCNLAILRSLAQVIGQQTPAIDEYLANKAGLRERLAEECGADSRDIKEALISLIYGARLNSHPKSGLGGVLGYPSASVFTADGWVKRFAGEIKTLTAAVLQWSQSSTAWTPNEVVNVVGKARGLRDSVNGKSVKESQLLSHLVTGYEAWCLNAILDGRKDVVCLSFDGWIGGKVGVAGLEALILDRSDKEFGFPLRMQIDEMAL